VAKVAEEDLFSFTSGCLRDCCFEAGGADEARFALRARSMRALVLEGTQASARASFSPALRLW
jgi:hypothetical protein